MGSQSAPKKHLECTINERKKIKLNFLKKLRKIRNLDYFQFKTTPFTKIVKEVAYVMAGSVAKKFKSEENKRNTILQILSYYQNQQILIILGYSKIIIQLLSMISMLLSCQRPHNLRADLKEISYDELIIPVKIKQRA